MVQENLTIEETINKLQEVIHVLKMFPETIKVNRYTGKDLHQTIITVQENNNDSYTNYLITLNVNLITNKEVNLLC